MNPSQILIANLVAVLLATAVLGLAWSGRASLCRSFTVFVGASLVTNRLVVWWPATFFTYGAWAWKEAGYVVLQLAIALELAVIGLAPFPRARRLTLLAVTAVTTVTAVCAVTLPLPENTTQISVVLARAHTATLWAFAALAFVVAWFHLPLDPFHRVILLGFVLDLSLYGALLSVAGWAGHGTAAYRHLQALDPVLFAATVGLWAIAAWHPRTAPVPNALQEARP